jgi:hypothetical protein
LLAFVVAVAVVVFVIVALGEALFVLQVGPSLHHVSKLHIGSRAVASEVVVDCFGARPFWRQWMMSSSVMLAMVARISKKRLV